MTVRSSTDPHGPFDLCVIGAGTAGFAAAELAREEGYSVGLIDAANEPAGTCILRGCMPAKAVLESAQVAHVVDTASEFGVAHAQQHVDPRAIVERKRHLVADFKADRMERLERFPLLRGLPAFVSSHEVSVGDTHVRARKFLIATGSRIVPPRWPGLRESGYITSTEALELTDLPPSMIVLGGGPVGCEFAQYFARLGVRMTLVQDAPTLLAREDTDVGEAVRAAFEAEGIRVVTDASGFGLSRRGALKTVHFRAGGRDETLEADEILLATGRRPNVEGFALQRAGIEADPLAGIRVDPFLRTTNPDVYAAGDAIGRRCLVHAAEYAGKLAVRNAFGSEPLAANFDLYETHSVYTHPEVAVAGLTERECRRRGLAFESASYPFAEVGRAQTAGTPEGFCKMLAARDGTILGISFVGGEASDLVQEASTLLYFKATVSDVLDVPHLHPTMGEIITYPAQDLCARLGLRRRIRDVEESRRPETVR